MYLVPSSDNLLNSIIVKVVPVRDLNLSPKSRVDRFHGDLGEGSIKVYNTSHCDGLDGAPLAIKDVSRWHFKSVHQSVYGYAKEWSRIITMK